MKPHPRIRRSVKWAGAVVSVVLVVVWGGSAWWYAGWQDPSGAYLSMEHGAFVAGHLDTGTPPAWLNGWHVVRLNARLDGWFDSRDGSSSWLLPIPLWPLVAIAVLATAAAWYVDALALRRAHVGRCPKCGYDRAGLPPASPCPECDAPPPSPAHS